MTYDQHLGLRMPAPETAETRAEADRRLALLDDLGLLHPQPALDQLAADLAAEIGSPYAMVNMADRNRQFFTGLYAPTGREGLEDVGREMAPDHGYCPEVLRRKLPLVLTDVYAASRFVGNPVVDLIGIRTYAGARLTDPDTQVVLGTICAVGTSPRDDAAGDAALELIKHYTAKAERLIHQMH